MKRLFLPIFVFLLLACNSALLGAFELEVLAGVDGMTFNPDKTSAHTEPDMDTEFVSYPYLLANVSFRQYITEILNFSVNLERDNVLQNSINAVLGAKTDFINVNFGIFMGLTDKFTRPDAGITGNLELIAFKIVYLSVYGSSTLGVQYGFTSNNYRETAGIKLGFSLGNATLSVSSGMKSFSRQIEDDIFLDDTLHRFLLNLDFLIKDFNISGYVNVGYQSYSRVYKKDALEFTDSLNAYLAGFGVHWHNKPLGVKLGFEMPFILSAEFPMTVTKEYLLFSRLYAGIVYSFDKGKL